MKHSDVYQDGDDHVVIRLSQKELYKIYRIICNKESEIQHFEDNGDGLLPFAEQFLESVWNRDPRNVWNKQKPRRPPIPTETSNSRYSSFGFGGG